MALFVFLIAFLGINQAALAKNSECSGNKCKKIISMPLLDDMKATLKADLDVTQMNIYLQEFIKQEVQTGIQTAMKYVVEEMVNNRTNEIQERIITMFKDAEEQNDDTLARKLTDFESKFELTGRQKYAFFAYLSSDKSNLPRGTIIKFDEVSLNIGNSYNVRTGKFTCKQGGIYSFSWTILSKQKEDLNSGLVLDGTEIANNIVDNDEVGDEMTGSTTVVVKMKAGQSVWIRIGSEGDYLRADFNGHGKVTVFSGFMI